MTDYLKTQSERNASLMARSFADWERRFLRGWQVWDYAVGLEPVFTSIRTPAPQIIAPVEDDARIQGGLGRFFGRTRITNSQREIAANSEEQASLKPTAFYRNEPLSELSIILPKEYDIHPAVCEQFFLSLSSFPSPVSFEILADSNSISIQYACDTGLASYLKNQIKTFFPDCIVNENQAVLKSYLTNQEQTVIADFGLARNFLFPLQTFRTFTPDPLTGLISSLGNLREGEKAILQILFQKTKQNWAEEISKVFANADFKTVLSNQTSLLREKFSSPLFAVLIRLAVESPNEAQRWNILRRIGGSFAQFSTPNGNELVALSNDGLSPNNHFLSVLNRTSYRSGMLLSAAELAALAHPPSSSVKIEKLQRDNADTKACPDSALNHSLILGMNEHQGNSKQVTLSSGQRTKHAHLVGASGSGKSTLLLQMMVQDMNLGNGFACFDPHGDLIDNVVERIPENRLKDVILFDPADEDYSIGFNVLSAHSELEKTLLSSDFVSIFRRFSTSWGDVMNSILANAVLAFLESSWGGSLIDLKRFLIERAFREDFLKTVADAEVRYYWQTEFPQLKGKPFAPLLTRLDTFLRSKLIRHIVANKENRLDFRKIMDERKILLVRLSLGAIGQENAYLLGSLLVSKLYHATLSRQNVAEENRPPFFLYLDEAHHFVTESMNQILSGVRKYKLGLILAHQQLRQFQAGEADILASVLANCYTRVCFRLDDADAERLARGFSFFTAEHLKNLGVGEAVCRFEQSQYDFNLKTFPLEKVPAEIAAQRRRAVIEQTRKLYAKPKSEIEAENQRPRRDSIVISPISSDPNPAAETQESNVAEEEKNLNQTPIVTGSSIQENQGRGGRHHQELQTVIKRMAEGYGFGVETEKSVLDGSGFVDVSLEKENLKIAVEVSVTSTADYETHNVLKCFSAGYDYALVVVSNRKKISAINNKISESMPFEMREKVKVLDLPALLAFLREITSPKEATTKAKEKPAGQRLSFAEACEFFGVGASTLYRWIREGRVPFYRPGREYQFDRDELVLLGKHDLSGKRKATVKLEPLRIEKTAPKTKKKQDLRYRKLLNLE